jgi:hypothetical protein
MNIRILAATASVLVLSTNLVQALTEAEKAQLRAKLAAISDEQFSADFRCPESLNSQAEQVLAVTNYFNWASSRHPDWNQQKLIDHRVQLLEEHQCTETLRNLQRNSAGAP